jgi:hypothetical protein
MLHIIVVDDIQNEMDISNYYRDCGFQWVEWNELCHPDRPYNVIFIKNYASIELISAYFKRINSYKGNYQVTVFGKLDNKYLSSHLDSLHITWRYALESNT